MSSGIHSPITGYHNRRSTRLRGYDYSQPGYYFVTICVHNRDQNLFGDVVPVVGPDHVAGAGRWAGLGPAPTGRALIDSPAMHRNECGIIVQETWDSLIDHIPGISTDAFVIMPNHVHGIIQIIGPDRAGPGPAPTAILTALFVCPVTLAAWEICTPGTQTIPAAGLSTTPIDCRSILPVPCLPR